MNSTNISKNIDDIRRTINESAILHGRNIDDIRLIAVSKTRPANAIVEACRQGQLDFGENTLQDAQTKIPQFMQADISWHFIGHLQSNKSRYITEYFNWLHTLDSLKLAKRIQQECEVSNTNINCLLQVNITEDTEKFGLLPEAVHGFIEHLLTADLSNIRLRGLMTIGKKFENVDDTRYGFSQLRELLLKCQSDFGLLEFDQLSMGMSGDFTQAIAEGSTMLRIGSQIFGQRNY